MIINNAPIAIPVHSVSLPTEAARNDASKQKRVPESKPVAESVSVKDANDQNGKGATDAKQKIEQAPQKQNGEGAKQAAEEKKVAQREKVEIQNLKERDREVRNHEAAHASAGGKFSGSPSYTTQRGPDGVQYAVAGEVPIDVSKVSGDPAATKLKMQQVKRAALAPANPSSADRQIASKASSAITEASAEIAQQALETRNVDSKPESESADSKEVSSKPENSDETAKLSQQSPDLKDRTVVDRITISSESNASGSAATQPNQNELKSIPSKENNLNDRLIQKSKAVEGDLKPEDIGSQLNELAQDISANRDRLTSRSRLEQRLQSSSGAVENEVGQYLNVKA